MDPKNKPSGDKRQHGELLQLPGAQKQGARNKRMKTKEVQPERMIDIHPGESKRDKDEKKPLEEVERKKQSSEEVESKPDEDEKQYLEEVEPQPNEDEKQPPAEGRRRRLTHSFASSSEVQIPRDVTSFSELRDQDNKYIAVDKSMFIAELLEHDSKKAMLITRPRRFGKSVLLTMLGDFLDNKRTKDEINKLFTGLEISKWKHKDKYMGKYPVILLVLSEITGATLTEWELALENEVIKIAGKKFKKEITEGLTRDVPMAEFLTDRIESFKHPSHNITNVNSRNAITNLIMFLNAYYQSRVVILIDEYDAPYETVRNELFAPRAHQLLGHFYNICCKVMRAEVEICLLMGLAPFVLNGFQSQANNILRIGLKDNLFRQYIGFTSEEIRGLIENGLELMRGELKGKLLRAIKLYYDGYFFGEDNTTYYCSYVVTNYLEKVCNAGKYVKPIKAWAETGRIRICFEKEYDSVRTQTIEVLTNILQEPDEEQMDINNLFSLLPDKLTKCPTLETVLALLYHYGYLTYDYTKESFRVPNEEVKCCILDLAKELYGVKITGKLIAPLLLGKTAEFEQKLRAVLAGISYFDNQEAYYHGMLYALMYSELSNRYEVRSNRESAKGRYDILAKSVCPRSREYGLVIIEVKRAKTEFVNLKKLAQNAIKQIRENQYGKEDSDGKRVIWVGAAFFEKAVELAYVIDAKY